MSGKSKAFGLLLILAAVTAFAVNFGLWKPFLLSGLDWFWNPLVYFFGSKIAGNIWLISDAVRGIVTFGYSAILFVIGAFAVLK